MQMRWFLLGETEVLLYLLRLAGGGGVGGGVDFTELVSNSRNFRKSQTIESTFSEVLLWTLPSQVCTIKEIHLDAAFPIWKIIHTHESRRSQKVTELEETKRERTS